MEGLCKEGVVISESLRHVQKVSKALSVVFRVVFVLSCASCVALSALSVYASLSEAQTPFLEVLLTTLPVVLSRLAFVLVLWCLASAFDDISKGSTPFSKKQVGRIRVIGILLLASAIAEFLITANYSNIVQVGSDLFRAVCDVVNVGFQLSGNLIDNIRRIALRPLRRQLGKPDVIKALHKEDSQQGDHRQKLHDPPQADILETFRQLFHSPPPPNACFLYWAGVRAVYFLNTLLK